jgi:hypothetical protein
MGSREWGVGNGELAAPAPSSLALSPPVGWDAYIVYRRRKTVHRG